jgi:hypothetical protein
MHDEVREKNSGTLSRAKAQSSPSWRNEKLFSLRSWRLGAMKNKVENSDFRKDAKGAKEEEKELKLCELGALAR